MNTPERTRLASICMLVGAAIAVIGTLLPWIKVSTGFGDVSRNGLDFSGDATFILLFGVACGAAAVARLAGAGWRGFVGPTTSIIGLVAAAVAIYDYTQVNNRVTGTGRMVAATVGSGVYLCIVGSVLMTVGAGLLWGVDESKPELSEPASTVAT